MKMPDKKTDRYYSEMIPIICASFRRGLGAVILMVVLLTADACLPGSAGAQNENVPSSTPPSERIESLSVPAPGGDDKPAFLLPDVVVEGEDKSKLVGGARILEMDVPTVTPRQRPSAVEPGPSRYLRRLSTPFEMAVMPKPALPRSRGFFQSTFEQKGGFALAGALVPGQKERNLLWGQIASWGNRRADYEHLDTDCGWMAIAGGDRPNRKLGINLRGLADKLTSPGDAKLPADLSLLSGRAWLARTIEIGQWPGIVDFAITGGRAELETPKIQSTGSWAGIEATVGNRGSLDNLSLQSSRRAEVDLQIGLMNEAFSGVDDDLDFRWRGYLGHSFDLSGSLFGVGLGGGGDTEQTELGPFIMARTYSPEKRMMLKLVITPEVSFPQDYLNGCSFFEGSPHPIGIDRHLRQTGATIPLVGGFNPQLSPQIAWPAMRLDLGLDNLNGQLSISGKIANLQNPYLWADLDAAHAGRAFRMISGKDRIVANVAIERRQLLAPGLHLALFYKWSYDQEAKKYEAISYLAEHEARATIEARAERFLFGMSALYYGDASGSRGAVNTEPTQLDQFVDLSAFLGWSYSTGQVLLIAENLLSETTERLPGDGLLETRARLVWEQRF